MSRSKKFNVIFNTQTNVIDLIYRLKQDDLSLQGLFTLTWSDFSWVVLFTYRLVFVPSNIRNGEI